MKKIIRLTESDLTRIVNRVIKENEGAMGNDETPTLNAEDIESKIKDAAFSLKSFGTMTKNGAFINGAKWVIHNLTDAEIKHLRENSDSDDHSFFGL
jgi:hypothetical protein